MPSGKVDPEITTREEIQEKARPGRPISGEVAFPRHTLMKALTLADSIEKNNAGKPFDRLTLAKSVDLSPNSSGYRALITSANRYNITAGGYQADKIALTSLGSAIVAPTSDSEKTAALRTALLTPELFSRVYNFFNKKAIPREELFKNTLKKEFKVPSEHVDACYEIVIQNMRELNITDDIKGTQYLNLDKLNSTMAKLSTLTEQEQSEEAVVAEPASLSPITGASSAPVTVPKQEEKARVFISHSKNMKILDQMKQMLDFGGFDYEVAVDTETTAIPIPEKIFGLMRKCNCAVINVSADEQEKREDGTYGINQNVLIEIGAAFLQYDRRVILLVDKRIRLPSNLQGLYASYYEGDQLSWETGMKLQKALTEFRNKI